MVYMIVKKQNGVHYAYYRNKSNRLRYTIYYIVYYIILCDKDLRSFVRTCKWSMVTLNEDQLPNTRCIFKRVKYPCNGRMVDVFSLWSKKTAFLGENWHFSKVNHYIDFFVYFVIQSCFRRWLIGRRIGKNVQKKIRFWFTVLTKTYVHAVCTLYACVCA